MRHAICEDERPLDRLFIIFGELLGQSGVQPSELAGDPIGSCADLLGPWRKEQPVGLILDLLTRLRPSFGRAERVRLDEAVFAKWRDRRADAFRTLMRHQA